MNGCQRLRLWIDEQYFTFDVYIHKPILWNLTTLLTEEGNGKKQLMDLADLSIPAAVQSKDTSSYILIADCLLHALCATIHCHAISET